jgi:hypothetical protein
MAVPDPKTAQSNQSPIPAILQSLNDHPITKSPNPLRYLTDTPAPITISVVLGLPRAPATNGVPGLIA